MADTESVTVQSWFGLQTDALMQTASPASTTAGNWRRPSSRPTRTSTRCGHRGGAVGHHDLPGRVLRGQPMDVAVSYFMPG
jgi:hypothetical protein